MIMQLWHKTAACKVDAVGDYIKELLDSVWDSDTKFLVFAHHR